MNDDQFKINPSIHRMEGKIRENRGIQRSSIEIGGGISLQKGGRNTSINQPVLRPDPPKAMTKPAVGEAPAAATSASVVPPQNMRRFGMLPPRRGR